MSELMSEQERAAIEAAVVAAEGASGAEIVPVLLSASGAYPIADARGAAFGALLGSLGALAFRAVAEPSATDPGWVGAVAVALGALGGLALARIHSVRRALAGAELDERVDLASAREFLARNVFRTRDRTGILLLVSLFERQVRVLADEAVYQAVAKPVWERLATDVAREMKGGRPGEALLHAVEAAAALVVEYGPRRTPGDRNELPDAPATGE
jgi:putative membrane protein